MRLLILKYDGTPNSSMAGTNAKILGIFTDMLAVDAFLQAKVNELIFDAICRLDAESGECKYDEKTPERLYAKFGGKIASMNMKTEDMVMAIENYESKHTNKFVRLMIVQKIF